MKFENIEMEKLWNNYLISINENPQNSKLLCKSVDYFGEEHIADTLFELIYRGEKTAGCGCLWSTEEELFEKGDLSIVTNLTGSKGCIMETQKITIKKFLEITEEEAKLEGEGDLSLEYWRKAHKEFFQKEGKEQGKIFDEEMLVIFEEFKVVYKE